MTGELQPQHLSQKTYRTLVQELRGFCSHISGIASIVRPHPDYRTCALQAATILLATNSE